LTKVRFIPLLITALMIAMFAAKLFGPGGLNDGGFW
jgi:hypothetical protein